MSGRLRGSLRGSLRVRLRNYGSLAAAVLTPLLLLPLPLLVRTKEAECAFVLLLMAAFWTTELIPLPMTAMFPAIFFPMFGIMRSSAVAMAYFRDFHFLLVGVICLATSVEKWGLHRRIALRLVTVVGVNPAWLMLGFMSGCAFLSMWVQNTSAVAMVMPIMEAVLQQIARAKEEEEEGEEGPAGEENPDLQLDEPESVEERKENERDPKKPPEETRVEVQTPAQAACRRTPAGRSQRDQMACKAMSLGIAYSSNIGGIATLPGTSPNLIFSEYLSQVYPECACVSFGRWLLLCLPISAAMLLLTWLWLRWLFIGWDPQEIFTLLVFLLMVLLWLTRAPGFVPGWASLFPRHSGHVTDATVALLLGLLFFIVPAHGPSRKFEPMISWEEFQAAMPWKVALLVGGGFALAEGTEESGLSVWVAELLMPLSGLPVMATVTVACLIVTTVTEVASNAATISIFLPILSPLAEVIQVNPLYVLIPATLCTSFSFLLPVSNPPNAVVFAYGHLTVADMVKAGLGVNAIGVLAVLLAMATWGVPLFSLDTYPDWAPAPPQFNTTTAP